MLPPAPMLQSAAPSALQRAAALSLVVVLTAFVTLHVSTSEDLSNVAVGVPTAAVPAWATQATRAMDTRLLTHRSDSALAASGPEETPGPLSAPVFGASMPRMAAGATALLLGGGGLWKVYAVQVSLSQAFGLVSMGIWLVAQLPQMIKSQRNKKADDLSLDFLALWAAGDVCNFAGCLLIGATWAQTVIAGYFLLCDAVLLGQWWAFATKSGPGMSPASKMFWTATGSLSLLGLGACILQGLPGAAVGNYLGWLSGVVYLASRVPQIWQNFKQREVEDLSIYLFILAVLGNVTYAASILAYSLEPAWIEKQAPFLLGSVGTLAFDAVLVYQILAYAKDPQSQALLREGDADTAA